MELDPRIKSIRWQIAREMQDPSQITKQGEVK